MSRVATWRASIPNLTYRVSAKSGSYEQILGFIHARKGGRESFTVIAQDGGATC